MPSMSSNFAVPCCSKVIPMPLSKAEKTSFASLFNLSTQLFSPRFEVLLNNVPNFRSLQPHRSSSRTTSSSENLSWRPGRLMQQEALLEKFIVLVQHLEQ